MMAVGNGHRLTRGIADARYTEVSGLGHLVPHETPEMLLDMLCSRRGTSA